MKTRLRITSYIFMVLGALIYLSSTMLFPDLIWLSFSGWLIGVVGIGMYMYDFYKWYQHNKGKF